jgi:hypothetical protein
MNNAPPKQRRNSNATVRVGTEQATAVAYSAIVNAPQGMRQASIELLVALAQDTGDRMIGQAARYIDGTANDGAPLKYSDAVDEARVLVEHGATPWVAATVAASREGDEQQKKRVLWSVYRQLTKKY